MIALAIDASANRGTLALIRDGVVAGTAESQMRGAKTEELMPDVARLLDDHKIAVKSLDRVICGEGPGSFTSLRIAASIAKGMCMGANIPLYAMSSLGLRLAAAASAPGRYVVVADALRDEWYAGIFVRDSSGAITPAGPTTLVARDDIAAFSAGADAIIVGADAGDPLPHASGCIALWNEIERRGPADLVSWEPAYGRLAEAQVKWEAAHGRPLGV